ncbi:MAG: hypothetical protein KKA56_01180, partial [Gammaproteobacteria bacterium]|nr:hypothetical protein [Gammaproteobacteria bacterium]
MKIPVAELSGIPASNHNDHDLTVRPPRPPRPQAKKPAGAGQKPAAGAKPAAPRRPRPAGSSSQPHTAGGSNASGHTGNNSQGQGQRPAPRRSNPAPQRQGNN